MRNLYKFLFTLSVCAALVFSTMSATKISAVASTGDENVCATNLSANIFSDVSAATVIAPFQGSGCYNPCNRSYRRCQKKNGRYNKTCRAVFTRCWKSCDRATGFSNPMPAP